jgi:putative aldouronate transport system substrate-binding protein
VRNNPSAAAKTALGQKVIDEIDIKNVLNWTYLPLCVQWDYVDILYRCYKDIIQPFDNHRDRAAVGVFDGERQRVLPIYDEIVAYAQKPDPVKNNAGWATYGAIYKGVGLMGANADMIHLNYMLDYYPTPTMLKRQAVLASLEQRTVFGIVTGQLPLSQFDSFAAEWHALGGTAILKELAQQLG